jgi:hypothetical protein
LNIGSRALNFFGTLNLPKGPDPGLCRRIPCIPNPKHATVIVCRVLPLGNSHPWNMYSMIGDCQCCPGPLICTQFHGEPCHLVYACQIVPCIPKGAHQSSEKGKGNTPRAQSNNKHYLFGSVSTRDLGKNVFFYRIPQQIILSTFRGGGTWRKETGVCKPRSITTRGPSPTDWPCPGKKSETLPNANEGGEASKGVESRGRGSITSRGPSPTDGAWQCPGKKSETLPNSSKGGGRSLNTSFAEDRSPKHVQNECNDP